MTLQSQRMIGVVMAVVAVAAIVIAMVVQPIGEWGAWGYVVGAIALILVLIGLLAVVSKNPNLLFGRRNQASAMWNKIAVILIAIALVLMVIAGFTGGWTAITVLQVGIFAALEVMLLGGMLSTSKASA